MANGKDKQFLFFSMGTNLKPPPWGRGTAAGGGRSFRWEVPSRLPLGGELPSKARVRGLLRAYALHALSGCLQPDLVIGLSIFPRARQGDKQTEASSGRYAATFSNGRRLQATARRKLLPPLICFFASPLGRGGLSRSGKTERAIAIVAFYPLTRSARAPPEGEP